MTRHEPWMTYKNADLEKLLPEFLAALSAAPGDYEEARRVANAADALHIYYHERGDMISSRAWSSVFTKWLRHCIESAF